MIQVAQLLALNVDDQIVDFPVALAKEVYLVFKMTMHGALNGGGADPDAVSSEQAGDETEQETSISPKVQDAARARAMGRHSIAEQGAVPYLMSKSFLEERYKIRVKPARDPDLGAIDSDRAELAGMIDLQDAGDRPRFGR